MGSQRLSQESSQEAQPDLLATADEARGREYCETRVFISVSLIFFVLALIL